MGKGTCRVSGKRSFASGVEARGGEALDVILPEVGKVRKVG